MASLFPASENEAFSEACADFSGFRRWSPMFRARNIGGGSRFPARLAG
jgi:hypothetical protein